MKIREKLLLGFGLYIFLAIALGFFAYKDLQTITTRLTLVETSDDITNNILEVRRHEKNFLLFKDDKNLEELKDYLNTLKGNIDSIKAEIISEMGAANYEMIKKAIIEYEGMVDEIAGNFKSQKRLTAYAASVWKEFEQRIGRDEFQAFLAIKRYEKDFMISKDKETYNGLIDAINSLTTDSINAIQRYRLAIEGLFKLYEAEYEIIDKMRQKAREIQSFTENLSKRERADIAKIIKLSTNLLLIALLVILIFGAFVNIKLSNIIAAPIKKLEAITKKVAAGDFSERIEVKGKDELASLEIAFNQMETRLQDAISSLEHAIERLHEKQEELVEAEKLASLGRIAAGVAHEINNPLAIINEKAGLMQDLLKASSDSSQKERFLNLISGILNSIKRSRAITHSLLGFARKIEIAIKPLNLNEAVKDATGFLENEIGLKGISVNLNLYKDMPEIKSDKGQIEQVLLNIIKNAIDAVEEKGLIEISTGIKNQDRVYITVMDNGPGIPKDKLKQIFEPFFTTKERGKGTGLGLFVSYGIMKGLGGNIHVDSEVGKGSTFTIEMPVKTESLKKAANDEG